MDEQNGTVQLLRALRHDWLNDLQLIKANLSLRRLDRAQEIIEEIISRSKNEAKISNLAAPRFASYLLTYNLLHKKARLDLEVTGVETDFSHLDLTLSEYIKGLFEIFEHNMDQYAENTIDLSVDVTETNMTITFDFMGKIINQEAIQTGLDTYRSNQSIAVVQEYIQENEAVLAFFVTID